MTARRSIRMWPITKSADLILAVRHFLTTILEIPCVVVDGLIVDEVVPQQQPRQSRVLDEVLVRFQTSHDRDIVQSYASNLFFHTGKAGLRMELPDHLKGLFKQFEVHAGNLRSVHGQIKRSIRFDDTNHSLCMDVKLDNTGWHRLNKEQMAQISKARSLVPSHFSQANSGKREAEMRMIMLIDAPSSNDAPGVESEDDDSGPRLRLRSTNQSSM